MDIIVDNNMTVLATHESHQNIDGLYPGLLSVSSPDGATVEIGQTLNLPLDALKVFKKAMATAKRREVEQGGIVVGGSLIATAKSDQDRIAGAQLYLQANPDAVIDWKAESGWTVVNKAAVDAIASAVGAHVQACFTAEKAHHEAIDALAGATDVAGYDVGDGWPG